MRFMVVTAGVVVMLISGPTSAQNLIANPGFEQGNAAFQSDYSFSAGGNCCEGQYTVRGNGSSFNGSFVNPPPSSTGSTLMMVINGSNVANQRIWYQSIGVTPGQRYTLNVRGCTAVAGGPAIIQWQVSGALVGTGVSLPSQTGMWVDIDAEWTAPEGVTSIELAIRDLNTATFPNDFYLDDLVMLAADEPCAPDFNGDGNLDPDDLGDFINCYFSMPACPEADFNSDGNTDPDDLGDFINAYFAGC
ncbi:MAG: hypothetical protein AB7K52_15100 [Phycisphaerales bacterium]